MGLELGNIFVPYYSSTLLFPASPPPFQLLSCLHQTEWLAGPLGDAQTPTSLTFVPRRL